MLDLPPLDAEHSLPPSHFEQVVTKVADESSPSAPSSESLSVPEVENPTVPEVETPTTPTIEAPTVPDVVQPEKPMPAEEAGTPSTTEEALPTEGAEPTPDAEQTGEAETTEEAETSPDESSTETSTSDETSEDNDVVVADETSTSDETSEDNDVVVADEDSTGGEVVVDELPDSPSDDDLLNRAKEIQAIFADGFQWSDLGDMIKQSYEFIVKYQKMSSEEMRDAVVGIISHLIDLTDTPYLPDRFTDPLFKAMVPPFVDVFGHFIATNVGQLPTVESEKPSPEKLMEYAKTIKAAFDDGFQWSDLAVAVQSSIEFMGSFPFLPVEEKKECVVEIVNHVIDITDTPKLPDSYIDPIFKSMVPSFVEVVFSKIF